MPPFGQMPADLALLDGYFVSWKHTQVPGNSADTVLFADGANSLQFGAQIAHYSGNSIVFDMAGLYLLMGHWWFGNVNPNTRGYAATRFTPSGGGPSYLQVARGTVVSSGDWWDGTLPHLIKQIAVGDSIDTVGWHSDGSSLREVDVQLNILRLRSAAAAW